MKNLNGHRQSKPLRFNEIFTIWTHLGLNNSYIAANHLFFQHASDKDLKAIIIEFILCLKNENKQLEGILTDNAIALPPVPAEHPNARIGDIRAGLSVTDTEISAVLSMNIATGLVTSSQAMETSIDGNLAMMYTQFHMKNAILGAKLLQLSHTKGWLPVSTTPA